MLSTTAEEESPESLLLYGMLESARCNFNLQGDVILTSDYLSDYRVQSGVLQAPSISFAGQDLSQAYIMGCSTHYITWRQM